MRYGKFLIIMIVGLFSTTVFAQSEAFFLGTSAGVGGRALSMGSAYVGVSDDYSATLWNPAGLTQLRRMELFTSITNFKLTNDASFKSQVQTDKTSKTKLNSIGFAFPIPTYRGSMVFAVGYNKIRNFDEGFALQGFNPLDTVRAEQGFTEVEEGDMANWVFAGAVQVTPNLSVGAAFNLWRGEDSFDWAFNENDVNNNYYYNSYDYLQQIRTNFSATNFKLGAFYQLGFLGRIAGTIATPVKIKAKENWRETVSQVEDADSPNQNYQNSEGGKWDYGIRSPFTFTVGAALTMLPNIVLSADAEYTDWSQTRYTSEPPVGNEYRKNLDFKNNFRATTTIRMGGEFTIPFINTQVRAGIIHQPSPLVNAPKEANRLFYTAGIGLLLDKQFKLDIAYVTGGYERQGSYLNEYFNNVTEKIKVDQVYATMSIRF
ncbi:MAG: hypothetical protein GXO74_01195 [Calditrichaeota bacterium]|nr:hypothetical protein [Calditrichota bacterium]